MNRLPIEIENEIYTLYYSHIYYTNVISVFNKRTTICNEINELCSVPTDDYKFDSLSIKGLLKYYNNALSKIYEKEEVKRRLFQISFYNFRI